MLSLPDFNDPSATWSAAGSDIDLTANKFACTQGGKVIDDFVIIGIKKVPPRVAWGLGHIRDIHTMYGGICYVRLDSTGGGQIQGKARILFAEPEFETVHVIKEWRTDQQDNSAPTDKTKNPTAVPSLPFIGEDGYVILAIKPDNPTVDVDVDVSDADNKAIISITEVPLE